MSESTTSPPFNIKQLKEVLGNMGPKKYTTDVVEIPKFMVIFGKNGVGKSRLLKAIQQHIVNQENVIFPNMIIRKLDYGDEPDKYDPNLTEHPLVSKDMIESFFQCTFDKWVSLKEKLLKPVNQIEEDDVSRTLKDYKDIVKQEIFRKEPQECYFFEFRKYFRRQILKKVCFGSLEQLLMLNLPYDDDIKKINESKTKFEEDYKVKFDYKIEKNKYSIVEKLNLNELIEFEPETKPMFRIKFNQLSPGEKLILHFLLIYKDKDRIKIDKTKIKSAQVLLLDEPDSHCEPDLVVNLVNLIKKLLVDEMEIQVIMTSHNTTTMFSLQFDDNIHLLEDNGNGQIKFSKKDRDSTRDILAKNIDYSIDFMKLTYYQHYNLNRDFFHNLSNSYENMIKKMTRKDQENFKFSERKELFEKILNCNDLNDEIIEIDDKHKNLEDVEIENLLETDDKIRTYWPINKNNEAWDFMIFYKQKLYLYQVSTGKKTIKEQYKKSEKVMKTLVDKRLEYWINAKFFFVNSTIGKDIKIPSTLDEVFSITEIFENLFIKGDYLKNNTDHNPNELKMSSLSNGEKFRVKGKKLIDNSDNEEYEFSELIENVYEIDKEKNLYAIIFNDDKIILILKFEGKKFYMIHSLIGHSEKVVSLNISRKNPVSFIISSENEKEKFIWRIDINKLKSPFEKNYFILNALKKNKKVMKTSPSLKTNGARTSLKKEDDEETTIQ